jgi:DeoR/GlpR family transcriptional regulator of sugar metabolism
LFFPAYFQLPDLQNLAHFQVHETTIRRDLDELESQGLVVRIHGGVVPASIKQDEPDFEDRATENMLEKTVLQLRHFIEGFCDLQGGGTRI